MKRLYILFALVLCGLAAAAYLMPAHLGARGMQGAPSVAEQPIVKFNHKFHLTDAGQECVNCHPTVQKSKSLSENLHPTHEQCQGCHEEQIGNKCDYCHTNADNIEARVVPERSLFAHDRHVAMKDVECKSCHEGIDSSTTAGNHPAPSMEVCSSCHNSVKATNTCEACHTNLAQLLPKSHLRSDFRRYHGQETRLGTFSAECATCHTQSYCQECHGPVPLKSFGSKDLNADPRPRTSPKDQPAQTTIQRVHDLNYRLTHGIDAKARLAECATCHAPREFCVECHQSGGNINQFFFKPPSHNVPGFTTIGRGSGGGIHAQEARRDMESCVSCHDVTGQDPVCLVCHNPNGQVR